jgi:crotonobetainyl-CoA:carnitine CoA-transferase CaiB-like acyl-CoA transferase
MAPHGCYRTADEIGADNTADEIGSNNTADGELHPGQWLSIACADDAQWRELAMMIYPSLADDQRFATLADRKRHEDELDAVVANWVANQDRWELTKRLQAVGIAAFPSMSPQDLLADGHLEARGFFERLPHLEVGRRTHTGLAWRTVTSEGGVARPAPLLGQHTREVLRRLLGKGEAELDELHRRGIIG